MLILSFLVLLPRALLGFVFVHWIWRSVQARDLLIKACLAGPLGIGLSSLFSFPWVWAGLRLGFYVALESAAAILLFLFLIWKERDVWSGVLRARPRLELNRPALIWIGLLVLAFGLFAVESWIQSAEFPHGGWDAWNHWNVVSRFVYRGGEHWTGTFLRTGDHPDYPLLVPMANAVSWALLARDTIRAPLALSFFFTLCLSGLLFGLIYKLRDARQGMLAAIVLLAHSYMAIWAMAQYVDMDLAFYFLASAGLMVLYIARGGERSLPVLAGFASGLAAWTKNEGLSFSLLGLLVWSVFLWREDRAAIRNYLLGLAFPLLVVGSFKAFLAPQNDVVTAGRDLFVLIGDVTRYQTIFIVGAATFRSMDGSPLVILAGLLVYALLTGKSRNATAGLLPAWLILLGQLAVYFGILLITPYTPEWHVRSSIGRLYLHVAPILLLAVFLWLKSPDELSVTTGA